jgi:hypothetical protein
MISSVLVFGMCIVFSFKQIFKLVPEIVQCYPPQSEVILWLGSDAVSVVSLYYTHSFIALFSVYPYTGKIPRMWK